MLLKKFYTDFYKPIDLIWSKMRIVIIMIIIKFASAHTQTKTAKACVK